VPAALLLFAAHRALRGPEQEAGESAERARGAHSLRPALLAGLLAGLAFCVDYAVALAGLVLFAYAGLSRPDRRAARALAFAAGAGPALLFLLFYNAVCFGSPFSTGFQFVLDPRYAGSYQSGLLGIQPPDPRAILGLTLLPKRGLAYLSPMLLLAAWGWFRQWRERRSEALLPLLVALAIAGFASTAVDWQSGWSVGSRYLVPAIPFLMLGVAAALCRARPGGAVEILFRAAACAGVAMIGLAALSFPHFPKEFGNPLWQLALPLLAGGHLTRNLLGASGIADDLVPFALLLAAAIGFLAFRSWRPAPRFGPRRGAAVLALAASLLVVLWATAMPAGGPIQEAALRGVLLRMGY